MRSVTEIKEMVLSEEQVRLQVARDLAIENERAFKVWRETELVPTIEKYLAELDKKVEEVSRTATNTNKRTTNICVDGDSYEMRDSICGGMKGRLLELGYDVFFRSESTYTKCADDDPGCMEYYHLLTVNWTL